MSDLYIGAGFCALGIVILAASLAFTVYSLPDSNLSPDAPPAWFVVAGSFAVVSLAIGTTLTAAWALTTVVGLPRLAGIALGTIAWLAVVASRITFVNENSRPEERL